MMTYYLDVHTLTLCLYRSEIFFPSGSFGTPTIQCTASRIRKGLVIGVDIDQFQREIHRASSCIKTPRAQARSGTASRLNQNPLCVSIQLAFKVFKLQVSLSSPENTSLTNRTRFRVNLDVLNFSNCCEYCCA